MKAKLNLFEARKEAAEAEDRVLEYDDRQELDYLPKKRKIYSKLGSSVGQKSHQIRKGLRQSSHPGRFIDEQTPGDNSGHYGFCILHKTSHPLNKYRVF